jgi:hypothetical protein
MACLVTSTPCLCLRLLKLSAGQQTEVMLAHLSKVTELDGLVVGRLSDAGATMRSYAGADFQMSGSSLKRLQLLGPSAMTDMGLLQHTSLQQLTHLKLYSFQKGSLQKPLKLAKR